MIIAVYITTITSYANAILFPDNIHKMFNIASFLAIVSMVIFSMFCVLGDGPGFLPRKWKDGKTSFLIFCHRCKGFKAPRSEHCDSCDRCVLRMSHHCALLNVCVGHYNQKHFVALLALSSVASLQAIYTNFIGILRVLTQTAPNNIEGLLSKVWMYNFIFCIGFSSGILMASLHFLRRQLKSIMSNMSQNEEEQFKEIRAWKAFLSEPCPRWPYDVGAKANMKQVLNMSTLPLTNGVDNWQIAPSEQKDNEEPVGMYWLSQQYDQSVPRTWIVTKDFSTKRFEVVENEEVR